MPSNPRKQRNGMESVEYAVSICLRTTYMYNGSDCSMGSCTQKGIATPYSQLLISTAVVVFSRFSCLGITGVMRPPLNLPFLHNEGFFTKVQENYNILKDFVLKRTFIGQTCRFTPKTMNLITSHIVTCLCNIMSGLQNANLPKRTRILQHILFYSSGHARP